jgi:hypothetical protein
MADMTPELTIEPAEDVPLPLSREVGPSVTPWYSDINQKVRQKLQDKLTNEPIMIPESVAGVEELFDTAQKAVHGKWVSAVSETYSPDISPNLKNLTPPDEKNSFLHSKDLFTQVLEKEEYWKIEDLRTSGEPEVWRAAVLAMSEQNLEVGVVARQIVEKMSEDGVKKWGVSKSEMLFSIDFMMAIQPQVDQVYVSQLERSDDPKRVDDLQKSGGVESSYLYYDVADGMAVAKPLSEEFPQLHTLAATIHGFSGRIQREIANGTMDLRMTGLDTYLADLAHALESGDTNTQSVKEMWSRLQSESVRLSTVGCPVSIQIPSFVGPDQTVQLGLSMGILNSKETEFTPIENNLRTSAREVEKRNNFEGDPPAVIHLTSMPANGPDHMWKAGGYYVGDAIYYLDDEVEKVTDRLYETYGEAVEDLLPRKKLGDGRRSGLFPHEDGHHPSIEDPQWKLEERFGQGYYPNAFEEARADLKGAMAVLLSLDSKPALNPIAYIQSYLLENIEYMNAGFDSREDNSNSWYSFTGSLIVTRLFECGAIEWNGDKIKVKDAKLGVEKMAEVGEKIVGIYTDLNIGREEVVEFVEGWRTRVRGNDNFMRYRDKVLELSKK